MFNEENAIFINMLSIVVVLSLGILMIRIVEYLNEFLHWFNEKMDDFEKLIKAKSEIKKIKKLLKKKQIKADSLVYLFNEDFWAEGIKLYIPIKAKNYYADGRTTREVFDLLDSDKKLFIQIVELLQKEGIQISTSKSYEIAEFRPEIGYDFVEYTIVKPQLV